MRELRQAVELLQSVLNGLEHSSGLIGDANAPNDIVRRIAFAEQAKRQINDRRRRVRKFGAAMFGEPAWEMLLILYVEHQRSRLTVSRLCAESGAPSTTALRWLEYLEDQQLVQRRAHATDGRMSYVELTDKAVEQLESYLSDTLSARG